MWSFQWNPSVAAICAFSWFISSVEPPMIGTVSSVAHWWVWMRPRCCWLEFINKWLNNRFNVIHYIGFYSLRAFVGGVSVPPTPYVGTLLRSNRYLETIVDYVSQLTYVLHSTVSSNPTWLLLGSFIHQTNPNSFHEYIYGIWGRRTGLLRRPGVVWGPHLTNMRNYWSVTTTSFARAF